METRADRLRKRLEKKARRGFKGHPIATVAFYGPNDRTASKIVVGICETEQSEPELLCKWFADDVDVRKSEKLLGEVLEFIESHGVRSVALTPGIYGCPHEEGVDYAIGEDCPQCPFWAGKDRDRIFKDAND